MGFPARASGIALLGAVAAAWGCSSVFTRGVIDDGHGHPVGGATVRVLDESGTAQISFDITNANGCFLISARAPKGAKNYTIDVEASGFKPARQAFALSADALIAALAPASSEEQSRIHVATTRERADRWTPACAPPATMGSDALTPR